MSKQIIHLSKKRRPPPPISTIVCTTTTQYGDMDEQSQITMQTFNDSSQTPSSQANNFNDSDNNLQLQQLTADPYYFHTLSPHASKKLGLDTTQGLVTLKIQNARQQEKIEILSSQLRACKVENEQLKAENSSLLKEVMVYKQDTANYTNDEQARMLSIYKRYEPNANSAIVQHRGDQLTAISDEDSVKLLKQENQKLKAENQRLQTLNEVMKKSFKAYIKDQKMKNGNLDNSEARKMQVQKRCCRAVPPSLASSLSHHQQQQSTATAIQARKSSITSSISERSPARKSRRGKALHRTISTSERTALTSPDSILDDSRSSYRSSIKVKVVPLDTSSRSSGTMKMSNANEVKARVHKVQHRKTAQPTTESSTSSVKKMSKSKTDELLVDFGSTTSSKQPVQEPPARLLSFRRTLATLKEEYMTR